MASVVKPAYAIAAAVLTILGVLALGEALRDTGTAPALTNFALPVEAREQEGVLGAYEASVPFEMEGDGWKFVSEHVQARTFDALGRVNGTIYASMLAQGIRTMHGMQFPDQPRVTARDLALNLTPREGVYRPSEFFEGFLRTFLEASQANRPSRLLDLDGYAAGSDASETLFPDADEEDVPDADEEHGSQPTLWELDAKHAQIEFLTQKNGKLLVSADALNAAAHNGGMVFLTNGVTFKRDGKTDFQASEAVWSILTNVFYLRQGQAVRTETNPDYTAPHDFMPIGCAPSPVDGWLCFCSASYPSAKSDPLATLAFRVRAEFSRRLGFCETFLGPLVCQ